MCLWYEPLNAYSRWLWSRLVRCGFEEDCTVGVYVGVPIGAGWGTLISCLMSVFRSALICGCVVSRMYIPCRAMVLALVCMKFLYFDVGVPSVRRWQRSCVTCVLELRCTSISLAIDLIVDRKNVFTPCPCITSGA